MLHNRSKLFGTWKNRLTCRQSVELAGHMTDYIASMELPFELVFCPPMVALQAVAERIASAISISAQNVIWDDSVSFTGETSAEALREIGCKYVIIGHSERRIYLGEDDEVVAKKASTAIKHGLIPVVCIGEFYEDHESGRSEMVVERQMSAVMPSFAPVREPNRFVIAYEPAWAISTSRQGLKCEPSEANQRHRQIRDMIQSRWGSDFAEGVSVIYGGSVDAKNAEAYFGQSEIDGGLVGTASQTSESFGQLIDAARHVFAKKGSKA